jgi:hypothetical protein
MERVPLPTPVAVNVLEWPVIPLSVATPLGGVHVQLAKLELVTADPSVMVPLRVIVLVSPFASEMLVWERENEFITAAVTVTVVVPLVPW